MMFLSAYIVHASILLLLILVAFSGKQLAEISPQVAQYLSPHAGFNKHKTCIVHGDYKSANIFIKNKDDDTTTLKGVEVSTIDYQWTGPGLASTDLIYFLSMCLPGDYLLDSTYFLKKYWEYLDAALNRQTDQNETCNTLTFEEFQLDFKIALLDFTRWAFCARLKVFYFSNYCYIFQR